MMTPEEELEFAALIEGISDTEKFAFGKIVKFIVDHPDEGLLNPANLCKAGCKTFEDVLRYLYESDATVPSHA